MTNMLILLFFYPTTNGQIKNGHFAISNEMFGNLIKIGLIATASKSTSAKDCGSKKPFQLTNSVLIR